MKLWEAVYYLETLLDQCRDESIRDIDLIEFTERDEAIEALAIAVNLLKPMASA